MPQKQIDAKEPDLGNSKWQNNTQSPLTNSFWAFNLITHSSSEDLSLVSQKDRKQTLSGDCFDYLKETSVKTFFHLMKTFRLWEFF